MGINQGSHKPMDKGLHLDDAHFWVKNSYDSELQALYSTPKTICTSKKHKRPDT